MVKTPSSDMHMQNDLSIEDDERKMAGYSSNQGTVLRRSGKSSKQKWSNNQKTDPRHKSFTPQEEELVIQLHAAIGSRWPIIAQQFPGKTDNDVKILWNSKLRKKLSAMGIDPVTHRPFSQILADYGNIGAFPKARTRFTSLSRDLKSAIMLKSEHPQTFMNPNNHMSGQDKLSARPELSDNHHSLDLYSQLQTINLVTETSNYTKNENKIQHLMTDCASSSDSPNDEIPSFSWSDFLLEDVYLPSNVVEQQNKGKHSSGGVEDNKNSEIELVERFEASSSSNTSFVEAMIESQDEMFSQFPGLYEEPFYY